MGPLSAEVREAFHRRLLDGLSQILEGYPQVSSPAVQAGVIGDFEALLLRLLESECLS